MRKLITLIVLLGITISLGAQELPNKFTITEDVISIGTDFTINDDIVIHQKLFNLTSTFKLYIDEELYTEARQAMISIGSSINIYDNKGIKIGTIQERIFNSWGVYSKYEILDKNGKLIASSEKRQLMVTSFTLKDTKGNTICKISRPAINIFSDEWSVDIYDKSFDKRLLVFIPCYKTHRDTIKKK